MATVTGQGAACGELPFDDADFEQVRRMIHERAGIALADGKRQMVYSRLARRVRATGAGSFARYIRQLRADRGHPEWEHFVNALTTNLTAFLREGHHFEHLRAMLPEWARRDGRVEIWCCAASTGEEAWSLAITAAEAFGSLDPPVRILASDIDTRALEQARVGVYAMERVESLDRERLRAFFQRGTGPKAGLVRVRPELRRMLRFARINLVDPRWPVRGPLHAIFCRNVMIYFDKPTQRALLTRFASLLRCDGLLYAGHSESFTHAADLFRSVGRTIYRNAAAAAGAAA